MSADPNVLTLGDYAMLSNNPLVRAAFTSMIEAQTIFQDVPLITRPTLKQVGERTFALPSVNWAGINQDPTVTKTAPKSYEEAWYFYRNQFQIDRWIAMDENAFVNPLDYQIDMYFKAVAYEMNDAFFNNTHRFINGRIRAANENCFIGIRERLDNPQYQMQSTNKVLSTTDFSSITATQANNLLQEIANLFFNVGSPEGTDCVLYVSETMLTKIEAGIRILGAGGGFDMTRDAYGRTVSMYKNAKIRTAGRKAPVLSAAGIPSQSQIIAMTETVAGEDSTTDHYTSIYCVRYGMNSFFAWQMAAPMVQADAYLDNGVTRAATVEGGMGINSPSHLSIARLYGVKVS